MISIRQTTIIILLVFLIGAAAGCSKPQCTIASDCKNTGTCRSVQCMEKKCVSSIVRNCCGNGAMEDIENGKAGNQCTCPQDYGACGKKANYTIRDRTYETKYLRYSCTNDNKCVLGVEPKDITVEKLVDERDIGFFVIETQTTYNYPFDTSKDEFSFFVRLKDISEDVVSPIKITIVQLKEADTLYGEKVVNQVLTDVGDTFTISIPVNYVPKIIEEERTLSYKLDYEVTYRVKKDRNPDGTYNYENQTKRDSYDKKFASKIFLVDSEAGR